MNEVTIALAVVCVVNLTVTLVLLIRTRRSVERDLREQSQFVENLRRNLDRES